MSRKSKPKRLDGESGVLDVDRGSASAGQKLAVVLPIDEAAERAADRAGLRDLDAMMEAAPGLSRLQRDAQRIMPRPTPGEIPYPVMERRLPAPGQERRMLSGRQQKARNKTKRLVQNHMPKSQRDALRAIAQPSKWAEIGDALSDATGDIEALRADQQLVVKRVDRAIQAYERANDRGHVVYANVQMPKFVNHSSLLPYSIDQFRPGDVIAFDRYTGSHHSLAEVSSTPDPSGRIAVFEIQTRRGMYVGHSEGVDSTGHILPRAMELQVIGVHPATYRRRDGSTGSRIVIQLTDTEGPGND